MSRWLTVLSRPEGMAARYGFAVIAVACALAFALLLRSVDITATPFLIAIAITVWAAGTGPGLLAIVLSLIGLDYFFIPPHYDLSIELVHVPDLLAFTALALAVSALSASRRRAERTLRRGRDELESIVAERTVALRRSEAYLAEAQRLTHTGSFVRNVATGDATHSSDEHTRLFGFDPADGIPSQQAFLSRIHPDDLARFHETFVSAIRDKQAFDFPFRVRLPDSAVRHLQGVATPVFDPGGDVVEYLGTTVDVTDRTLAEQERQANLWFFESMDRVNRAMQGTSDLEQMMSDVLAEALSVFDCDRAWVVYPCDPDAPSWQVAMEHTRPEFPGGYAARFRAVVDADIASVFRLMRAADGPVRFGADATHPLPPLLIRLRVQSQIAMTLEPKLGRAYMFGLHQCSYARRWTAREEQLFEQIGRRLTDALTTLLMFRHLRESEAKLEQAQRVAHLGHWHWDIDTGHITWSDETYRIAGLTPRETPLELDFVQEIVQPDDRMATRQALDAALAGRARYDVEYRMVRPDGDIRVVHAQGDVARDDAGRPSQMFGTVQDVTERKRSEQAMEALAGRLIDAQEAERSRIGRELHDHVSQTLGLLLIKIDQLRHRPEIAPVAGNALSELRETASDVVGDVHRLSHRLHSSMLEHLGLVPALQKLVAEFSAHHTISLALVHDSMPATLPADVALALFRVVEESLTNIAKHSRARSARVACNGTPEGLQLSVEDDGDGFDTTTAGRQTGLGLVSMQERLRLIHGSVQIKSAPSRGTTIDVRVPAASLLADHAAGDDEARRSGTVGPLSVGVGSRSARGVRPDSPLP